MSFKITNPKEWSLQDLPPAATYAIEDAAARLDAVDEFLGTLGGEPYVSALASASKAIRAAVPFASGLLKDAATDYSRQLGGIATGQKLAKAKVPTSGFFDPGDRERAVSSAGREVAEQHWAESVSKVLDQNEKAKARADAIASASVDAMREAKKQIEAERAEWDGPTARRVRNEMNMDRLSKVAALRDDLRGYTPSALLSQVEVVIAAGNEADEDDWVLAVEPVLAELAKKTPPQLAAHLEIKLSPATAKAVEREQGAIHAVRRRIRERHLERMPEALKAAPQVYSQLLGAFSLLFGFNATLVTRSEYERHHLGGSPADELAVHPRWLLRMFPKAAPIEARAAAPAARSPWR